MPVDRPTFSESWYRVSGLRPRLRFTVQVSRQHFRGRMWHVLQDPGSNQFFRLNEPAYQFVALLDGRRDVAQAWAICNEELGDNAPTQGEVIQLLGQLYTSNLLHADLPPDAEGLFRRYRKRVTREVQGYLMNLLFIRIPLLDPDHFLDRWVRVLGRVFTWFGFVMWVVLLTIGLYFVAGRGEDLVHRATGILSLENLPLLYVAMVLIKVFHEFGHAFACKEFGRRSGTGGEVHVMGMMLLVFTPLPYMDASSAWAFRRKWHRVVVGTAGMMVELAVASVAAIIWANSAQGTTVHALAYNMMFIASVSTLLFNANPLLRFDGYYILSDLLEIPNLSERSKRYVYYLIRRYLWRVRKARSTAHTKGERIWLPVYGVASTLYRVFISVAILLFVAGKLLIVGVLLALMAVVTWVLVPLGKFLHYLTTHGELERVRPWAIGSTLGVIAAIVACVGLIPMPDRYRLEGVVEPTRIAFVHAETDGFVREVSRPSGQDVERGAALLIADNPELVARHERLLAELRRLRSKERLERTRDIAMAQALAEQVAAVEEQELRAREEIESLTLRAPLAGRWIAPEIERIEGAYVRRGDKLGLIASVDDLIIRATAGQDVAGELIREAGRRRHGHACHVELRIRGRPDSTRGGEIIRILPAGQEQLPSAALGYAAGGSIQTAPDDVRGTRAAERFFEIHILPDSASGLLSGQRIAVRVTLPSKPLAVQWWHALLRLFQRRFQI